MLCFSGKVLTYLIHLLEAGPDESIYPEITVLRNLVCRGDKKRVYTYEMRSISSLFFLKPFLHQNHCAWDISKSKSLGREISFLLITVRHCLEKEPDYHHHHDLEFKNAWEASETNVSFLWRVNGWFDVFCQPLNPLYVWVDIVPLGHAQLNLNTLPVQVPLRKKH